MAQAPSLNGENRGLRSNDVSHCGRHGIDMTEPQHGFGNYQHRIKRVGPRLAVFVTVFIGEPLIRLLAGDAHILEVSIMLVTKFACLTVICISCGNPVQYAQQEWRGVWVSGGVCECCWVCKNC